MSEHMVVFAIEKFPVTLRAKLKAKAALQGKDLKDLVIEALEREVKK